MTSRLHEGRWSGGVAPVVETARLRLRAHTPDDLACCHAMWSDRDVTRFIGGRPQTREEVWGRLLRYAGMWRFLNHGFWAVEDRVTAQFVGEVGVMEVRREMIPSFEGEPEIGWALAPGNQGKGYASEMVEAAIGWAGANIDAPKLVCMISPENGPSLKLADKFGFRERLRTTYHGAPTIQFDRPMMLQEQSL